MNSLTRRTPYGWLSLITILVSVLPLLMVSAAPGYASSTVVRAQSAVSDSVPSSDTEAVVEFRSAPVLAWNWRSALGNRTRMIQITLVVVAIGIGFLMWGKK